jgi:malonyl-CoA O-methyltransferase
MSEIPSFRLNKGLIRASFERAAETYDAAAALQREVGQRMLDRLDYVRLNPELVVDLGCGTGVTASALLKRYRHARVLGLDIAFPMLAIARERAPWLRRLRCLCADLEALPLADASCDLLFSNLTLQWCDLDRAFLELRRVLKPGGLLIFSTLGPDTLLELRRSWQAVDAHNHVNAFIDMHDVGDALLRAALADPVMDVERITVTYREVIDLMRDLKHLGAHNVSAGRPQNLTGKGKLRTLRASYERFRTPEGLLPATYEVVYGHAWAPTQPLAVKSTDGGAVFPLSRLRRRGKP